MADWFKTNRGWLIPAVIITGVIVLMFSYTLHIQHEKQGAYEPVAGKSVTGSQPEKHTDPVQPEKDQTPEKAKETTAAPKNIQIKQSNPSVPKEPHSPAENTEQKTTSPAPVPPQSQEAVESEKLSPEEVIQKLEDLPPKVRKKEEQKLLGRHTDWSVYLFSAKKKGDDQFNVTFDSSDTGFGVVVVAELDLLKYIGIVTARQGDKIRLVGSIAGIDVNGTGQIKLKVESIRPVNR